MGHVVGWECDEDERTEKEWSGTERLLSHVPKVVYVDFKDDEWDKRAPEKQWQLPGLEPGVYPIYSTKRTWHLDAYRKKPCLAVQLAQAFSHNLGLLGLTVVLKPPSSPQSEPVGLRK